MHNINTHQNQSDMNMIDCRYDVEEHTICHPSPKASSFIVATVAENPL